MRQFRGDWPAAGARLRDAGVRTPDFVVIGNGRAGIIEVDGPHHFGATRKADDHARDRPGTAAASAPSASPASAGLTGIERLTRR